MTARPPQTRPATEGRRNPTRRAGDLDDSSFFFSDEIPLASSPPRRLKNSEQPTAAEAVGLRNRHRRPSEEVVACCFIICFFIPVVILSAGVALGTVAVEKVLVLGDSFYGRSLLYSCLAIILYYFAKSLRIAISKKQ